MGKWLRIAYFPTSVFQLLPPESEPTLSALAKEATEPRGFRHVGVLVDDVSGGFRRNKRL